MSLFKLLAVAAIISLSCLVMPAAAEEHAPLRKFIGCWLSPEAYGTISTTDAFKPDGYSLTEDFSAVSIMPVEGGAAFRNLIKGTLDVWSDKGRYFIPTIYYGGVYDPVRDAIMSDSTFYVIEGRLIFVHARTTETRSDRALRYLTRVDCSEIEKVRSAKHKEYKPVAK